VIYSACLSSLKEPEFAEDRVVVREESNQKKSGWFSRKNTSTTPQKHVLRPPSTATSVNLKTDVNAPPNKAVEVEDNDDLPPRMEMSPPAPSLESNTITNSGGEASALSRPPTPPNDNPPSPDLPIHAGFDLVALKNILQEVEQDASKSQAPAPGLPTKKFFSRFTSSPSGVPFRRPESTPPIKQHGSASREDLTTPSFARSVSANIPNSKDDEDDRTYGPSTNTDRKTSLTSSFNISEDNLLSRTPQLRPDDSISLSDDIIPAWGASSTSVNTTSLSSNLPQYDRSIPSPPVVINPFASSSSVFGYSDGLVSGGMGFQADPWSIASTGKKKTTLDSYGSSSPWS